MQTTAWYFFLHRQIEDGVGREGSLHRKALFLRELDGRTNFLNFFVAKKPILAGVWIEARNRNPGIDRRRLTAAVVSRRILRIRSFLARTMASIRET